jgi:hypothetical protein
MIQLSEKSEEIIESIKSLRPDVTISIESKEGLELSNGSLGEHKIDDNTDHSSIIIDSEHIGNEAVISHELLHCYMYVAGYPKLRVMNFDNDIVAFNATNIENVLAHKIIQKKQDQYMIDTDEFNKNFVLSLGKNVGEEPDDFEKQFKFSFKILDAKIRCEGLEILYEDELSIKFPVSFSIASQLYNAIKDYDFIDPYGYRRAMIRMMRTCEKLLQENRIAIRFNELISTEFIPSKRQLSLLVDQVFDVKTFDLDKSESCILISKAENQASYFLHLKNDFAVDNLRRMSVEALLDRINPRYIVR